MTDPLNISVELKGVDAGLPLLPEADYEVQCVESTVEANSRKDGFNWNMKLCTTSSITAVDGRIVQADYPLYFTAALQAGPNSKDADAFRRTLGGTVDAFLGTTKENRPDLSGEVITGVVGRKCIAHVQHNEWPEGSGTLNNKVTRLKALPS